MPVHHGFSDGADDLRSLLAGYVGVLDQVDSAPAMLWARVERPRLLRWLRVPAPRALVRDLLVRRVSRRVATLRRRCYERLALADEARGPEQELARLEHFQRSLPTPVSLRVIVALALLGVLLVAYILANFVVRADAASLLGDLTSAAVELDRDEAVEAFGRSDLDAARFFGAGATLSWSVVVMLAPLLPAFSVRRRLSDGDRELSQLEVRGFAALGCRPTRPVEPDVIVHWLMIAATAFTALGALIGEFDLPAAERNMTRAWIASGVLLAIASVASAGLTRRHVERRQPAGRRRSRITSAALWLVWAINIAIFISLSTTSD